MDIKLKALLFLLDLGGVAVFIERLELADSLFKLALMFPEAPIRDFILVIVIAIIVYAAQTLE